MTRPKIDLAAQALLYSCVLALTGCYVVQDPPPPPPQSPMLASTSASAAAGSDASSKFFWYYGDPPTPMGAAAARVCFLSMVGGDFDGGGEKVHAYIQGGSWYLYGTAATAQLYAGAHCIGSGSYTGEYNWAQGQGPTTMMPAATHTCFLTRVQGHFEGAGEYVHATVSNGMWVLTGASQQHGVAAGARCFKRKAPANEYVWNKNAPALLMKPAGSFECMLTRVQGEFESNQEKVFVYETGGSWYLYGASQEDGALQARARCFVTGVIQPSIEAKL